MLYALLDIISLLLQVLLWIIIIQAILSWLVVFNVINTTNDFVRQVMVALDRITEPLYRPFRRLLPDLGGLDFSPMIVILLIVILERLVDGARMSAVA